MGHLPWFWKKHGSDIKKTNQRPQQTPVVSTEIVKTRLRAVIDTAHCFLRPGTNDAKNYLKYYLKIAKSLLIFDKNAVRVQTTQKYLKYCLKPKMKSRTK